jgi:glycosyltransferase involved in cell wall biosynthesis
MERLQALVDELRLAESVELLGTRSDVPELMRQSDLMVNSSEFEGLPIALIEAVMSALPIVATDVGGNSELVEPNVNGLLTPAGDPEALSQAVLSVLEDEARYMSMSLASSEKSRAFTLENCARAHLKLYADIGPKPACAGSFPTVKPLPIPDRGIHQKYSSRI